MDFVINDKTAVEIKAESNVKTQDYKGLRALKEEALLKNYTLVTFKDTPRKVGGIQLMPWKMFVENLWQDKYI